MKEIKTGDKFVCIKKVIMQDTRQLVYKKGFIYRSDTDCCITDEGHEVYHYWRQLKHNKDFKKHFIKIKN